ncbi:MAG TPA: JAB domain-containing protein [Ktedonobacteraceae bacterium]|nr:JAB domain-containing protein [Ktedonobacteraceae bacterium]
MARLSTSIFFLTITQRLPTHLISTEDWTLTTRLRETGDLLGIRLLDHLILGDDRLYSFADQGWPL